jgi:hypothetical protein
MTRIGRIKGTVLTSLLLVILGTLSCSKGYNKYAEEHYAQGKIFYENMEYGRSIDSFSKVLELAPAGSFVTGMLGGVKAVSQLPREHIMIASRISSAEQPLVNK